VSATQRRVFIECTHTYLVGGSSGIRRVARNLANAHAEASSDEVQLLPLVWAGRGFLQPKRPLTEAPHPIMVLGLAATRAIGAVARWPLLAPLKSLLKGAVHRLQQCLRGGRGSQEESGEAQPTAQGPAHGRGGSEAFYRVFGLLLWPLGCLFVKRVRFCPGDVVVLVDSTWDCPAMLEALFAARQREGIKVGAMLHDLFPLTLPHMCQASTVAGYTGWFAHITRGVDFFITNSAATTETLQTYLQQAGPASALDLPAGHFRLGAELQRQAPTLTEPNPLQALPGFVVLAVGTIEPRKNYQVILDALDLLWDKHDVSLVIVGRPGWHSESFLARLSQHPQVGARLLHLDDADDATLAACYQRADALVCASWAEGFGLPIVEGMSHGAPVLASDIAVFREVGGAACHYFAPDQPQELAAQLEPLLQQWQQGAPVRHKPSHLAIDWRESAIQFRDEVERLTAASPQP
jgi:glycosyltransferase involved in cell wall biosynthesis